MKVKENSIFKLYLLEDLFDYYDNYRRKIQRRY